MILADLHAIGAFDAFDAKRLVAAGAFLSLKRRQGLLDQACGWSFSHRDSEMLFFFRPRGSLGRRVGASVRRIGGGDYDGSLASGTTNGAASHVRFGLQLLLTRRAYKHYIHSASD